MQQYIGKLEPVPVQSVWKQESVHFTPWLKDHLDILSDVLHLELEPVDTEVSVGKYSLDLLARDLGSSPPNLVIVENQFGSTNHDHLGKLMTYAAGIDDQWEETVGSVVWIAEEFNNEHKAALEWLNKRGDEGARFFGLKLRTVKIGASEPAPLFEPVVVPTGWPPRSLPPTSSAKGEAYRRFFQPLIDELRSKHGFRGTKTAGPQSYLNFSTGVPGIIYDISFRLNGKVSVGIYINTPSQPRNKRIVELLKQQEESITPKLGGKVDWELLEDRKASRICVYGDGAVEEEDGWDSLGEWMKSTVVKFRQAVGPHLKPAAQEAESDSPA